MKVSVAMCTYNGARFLREQLESIAAQTRRPDELIICDDASTDNTFKLIQDFAATAAFPVVILRNEETLGTVLNFQQAMSVSTGEIIALADQDDIWNSNKLETLLALFSSHPATGMVFTDAEVVDDKGNPLGYRLWEGEWIEFGSREKELFRNDKAFELLLRRNVVTGATVAFRSRFKSLILPIPVDARFLHDGWIALALSAVSHIEFVEQPLMKYRRHQRQQIGVNSNSELSKRKPRRNSLASLNRLKRSSFDPEIRYLHTVVDRLFASEEKVIYTDFKTVLDRLRHFEARSALPKSLSRRLSFVARETFSGRYSRYSNGLLSAARDILS